MGKSFITLADSYQREYRTRWLAFVVAVVTVLVYSATARAADYGGTEIATENFNFFAESVADYLTLVLAADSNASQFIEAFFLFAIIYRLVIVLANWVLGAAELIQVFQVVLLIAIVRILMDFYPDITSALFLWSEGFAAALQEPALGTSDAYFAFNFMTNVLEAISYEDASLWDGIKNALGSLVLFISISVLQAVVFFALAWSVWGYLLAKLIGWMFIPFLLFDRLQFLFDGWLRFFVGFLIYGVMARANVVLVVLLFSTMFGVEPTSPDGPGRVFAMSGLGYHEIGGFIALAMLSIVSLFMTGRFAVAIAGGVGGFGQGLRSLTMSAAAISMRRR